MKRYPQYKASGLDGIGDIPAHWSIKRFKEFAYTIKGKGTDYLDDPTSETDIVLTLDALRQEKPSFYNYAIVSDSDQHCTTDDLVIIWDGAGVGEFLKAKKGVLSSTIAKICVDESTVLKDYLWQWRYRIEYLLKSIPTGMGVPHLNPTLLNQFLLAVPPLEEQRTIADYLNEKCGEIDEQVDLLDRKLKAYERLKTSLINDAVTHGLNSNATMRPSGIDWIGDIPAHWSLMRIKELGNLGSGTTPKSGNDAYYDNGTHPWINTGCVQNCIILEPADYVTDLAMNECSGLKYFPEDTILIAMYGGGTIGNVGIMGFASTINQACCAIELKNGQSPKFIFYALMAQNSKLISLGFGATQVNLSQGQIANFLLAVPPIDEQREIADYLNQKCSEIDAIVGNISKQIDAYKRLKKSLINEVITGKRAV